MLRVCFAHRHVMACVKPTTVPGKTNHGLEKRRFNETTNVLAITHYYQNPIGLQPCTLRI